jgi:hypothetical protein
MKRLLKRLLLALAAAVMVALGSLYLYTLPALWRLPTEKSRSLHGITTLDDAVAHLAASGKEGWELVTAAQQLVHAKMEYSRRNNWDSSARAFRRGMGYCQQQAMALQQILHKLGIQATPVFATQNRFPPARIHGYWEPEQISGHVWLLVTVDGVEKEVCPGHGDNLPGQVHFERLSPRRVYHPILRPFGHIGSMIVNVQRDAQALEREGTPPSES